MGTNISDRASEPRTARRSVRWTRWVSWTAFAYLTSIIVVMASERVYWYWGGITAGNIFEIALFYLIPTLAGLWALALIPAKRLHQVVLAGAVFAFVTEGVLTPIIYTDGPLPVLAALFVGWHGLLAFAGFWYLTRRLLVERRRSTLAAAAAAVGGLWGLWAMVASLADPPADVAGAAVMSPPEFALYAFVVGAVLAVAHWGIGFVWPKESWRPGRFATAILVLGSLAYMAVAVLPSVPWAPLKLAALLGVTAWLARRSRAGVPAGEPTVLTRLAGRVRLQDTVVLLTMPAAASVTYLLAWSVGLSDGVLSVGYWVFVAAQVIAGVWAFTWAARRSLRSMA